MPTFNRPNLSFREEGVVRRIARGLTLLTSCLVALALAAPAWSVTMESVEFSSLPGDKTEIRMTFDGTPPEPTGYTIEQPARIVLDMPGVESALEDKHHNLGIGNARRMSVVSTKDRTRAIVNLTQLVSYETEIQGNTLYLTVGSGGASGVPSPQEYVSADDVTSDDRDLSDSRINNVDFRRGEDGEGLVIVELSNPKAPVNVVSDGGRIRVEVRNTELPKDLQRRLDVTDFATPVQIVDALQEGPHTTFTVTATGNYDYLAYQADNTLSINVNPLTDDEVDKREDIFKYTGEKLSLNFQDIEVRSVLQLIADFTDLNLVASDTVAGRITLRLKNVPWDQALELILKTKGLDKRQVGNVLLVAPAAEIAAREKLELENQKQISELAPLRTEFIQIRYASASALFELFSSAAGENRESMLSERGSVIVDERTNAIILTDTAEKLEEFRRVIAQLDVPVRQVLIEARIVTANTNFAEEIGIRWGGAALKNNGPSKLKYGGSLDTLTELQDTVNGGAFAPTHPNDLIVDLGVTAANATSFGIGITGEDYLLDLELSALASDGHAEVVARPKVITADKSAATIESGVEIPYQEATSSGATSTSFKDAVLSLEVTPQITPDDRIIMELNVKQDTVGTVFNGVPSINTNEIETEVLVDNGQTVVLGGIFQTDRNVSTTKTPFLGDLPYVGRLFRKDVERDDKQELLIFITPRIIQDSLSAR
ncbi:MAG: type IV pilus secretin PilQ [Pseudomonadales bacterium]|nr:type IV pilus secretin PilQ [Pseudomonadales bacterium]NIX09626.1 type IV pilus secretin PilQ [Pseudomonadales bacterium]